MSSISRIFLGIVTPLLITKGSSVTKRSERFLEKREEKASSSKTRSERLATELPFFIKDGAKVPKKILLIDDIYTTGVTLNRVKKLLENAGADEVRTFSLVRWGKRLQ